MSRLLLTIAVIAAATPQAECADARAAWALASCDTKAAPCSRSAAALAWASARPCECGGTSPDCPCNAKPNPKGLVWRPAPKGDVNAGKVLYLIEPGKCIDGKGCTPEKIVGGLTIGTNDYQPFDGTRWGKSCKPPIELPTASADDVAELLAVALVGAIAGGDFADDCPGGVCPPRRFGPVTTYTIPAAPSATTFSGGVTQAVQDGSGYSVVAVGEVRRFAPLRRLLSAPFRAIQAVRQRRASAVIEFVQPAAAVGSTLTTYAWQPTASYTLQPVTESVPVTRYQWVPNTPAVPSKPAK